jgi:hypothetical protein
MQVRARNDHKIIFLTLFLVTKLSTNDRGERKKLKSRNEEQEKNTNPAPKKESFQGNRFPIFLTLVPTKK